MWDIPLSQSPLHEINNFASQAPVVGCLENSDLENSDPRPEKLRPSGVSKTQTLGCLENSDPKNSDPRVSRKLRPETQTLWVSRKLRPEK